MRTRGLTAAIPRPTCLLLSNATGNHRRIEYFVQVLVGQPAAAVDALIDTGSSVFHLACQGCARNCRLPGNEVCGCVGGGVGGGCGAAACGRLRSVGSGKATQGLL